MKKLFLVNILVCAFALISYAQPPVTDANVVGDVKCNGEHISYISVFVKGTTIGTTTDHTGHYQIINLSPGKHTIVAQGVGYKTTETEVVVVKKRTSEIKFDLEEDVLNLDGIVVTADRHEGSRKEAPVIVNTVTPKLFETSQAVTIATGLDFVPGLRMECNCQNCGFSQVRMNGMDGPYSQILINSRPVFSGLTGVYGLEMIPTTMVERIEVVRGGGSALFGGNAIAGTVNIITREPAFNSLNIEGRIGVIGLGNEHGTTPSVDKILNVNGSFVSNDSKSGIFLYGMTRERDPFDENGDGFSEMVSMSNTTLGFNAYYKTSSQSKLSLDFYRINEFRRGGNKFEYLPHEADIAEQVDHKITGANLTFDLFTKGKNANKLTVYAAGQTVDRNSYYGAEQDPNAYGQTDDLTTSIGGQYHMALSNSSDLLFGLDDNFNKLVDTKLGSNGNENSTIVDQYVNTLGSFAQYEWKHKFVRAVVGLRYDTYLIRDLNSDHNSELNQDATGNVLAPRVNLLFDINPTLQFRASYSKGYRAPQIFDEDLHIEASGSRRIIHLNAPGLTQETSNSITSSLRYTMEFGRVLTEVLAEGFYTRLKDPFAYEYAFIDSTKTFLQVRKNADDGAYVAGLNLEFNAAFPRDLTLQAGFTFQTSEYDSPQSWGEYENSSSTHFMRTPHQYGYLTLDWHLTERFSTAFTVNYTGSMYVPHYGLEPINEEEWEYISSGDWDQIEASRQNEIEAILNEDVIEGEQLEKSEQFLIFGLRVAYDLPISSDGTLQFYAGVQNLFNQTQARHDSGVYRDAGYIYGPCQPRTINFGIKFGNIFH